MRPMRPPVRPLTALAVALVLLTAGALVADLARPGMTDPLRRVAADVLAPAQAALAGWDEDELARLAAERDALAGEVARLREQVKRADQLEGLAGTRTWSDDQLLPARVVAFAPVSAPVQARTLTIDAGADDGVEVDLTVISADGLVGRVVRVASTSADVLVLGDPEVVVGVRFGPEGALGSVAGATPPGSPPRGHGELTLTALGDSPVGVGDVVTTLGSPDGRPYAADVRLGTVTAVDPDQSGLASTAVVTPLVDLDTLDLVAVVLPRSVTTPRSP